MRPKTYQVLALAVEEGVKLGWQRAHKHVDNPDEHAVTQEIESAVLGSICEWFTFDDEE